jgi:hypothetical protein
LYVEGGSSRKEKGTGESKETNEETETHIFLGVAYRFRARRTPKISQGTPEIYYYQKIIYPALINFFKTSEEKDREILSKLVVRTYSDPSKPSLLGQQALCVKAGKKKGEKRKEEGGRRREEERSA